MSENKRLKINVMSSKRLYSSPLFAEEKKSKVEVPKAPEDKTAKMEVSLICTEVNTKNSEILLSASFNVLDALAMWEQVFKQKKDLVFGVALIKTKDRGVGVNFKLKKGLSIDLEKFSRFEFIIGSDRYAGRLYSDRGPPPSLGELISVNVSGFMFHLEVEQIAEWISLYGKIEGECQYLDHNLAQVKVDTVIVPIRLHRHIPSVLPAFGRRMQVFYHGQPKVCGACYDVGHVRKNCINLRVEWMIYVKRIHEEMDVPLSMLGKWGEILTKEKDAAYIENGMMTPAKI